MLDSLLIRNFRLFRELKIKGLRRVNLFVGKNNTGKTALLEGVRIFEEDASLWTLRALVDLRDERDLEEELLSLRHLFYGHQFPETVEGGITVGPINGTEQTKLHTAYFAQEITEEGIRWRRIEKERLEEEEAEVDASLYLVHERAGSTSRILSLDPYSARSMSRYRGDHQNGFDTSVRLVPTHRMDLEDVAALWDRTSLTPREEEVIDGLRLLDPSIQAVSFVETSRAGRYPSQRIPLAKVSDFSEPVPLHGMGDGVARLFQLLLALVNAKDGVLLIDEFENGLHWSIQPKIWEVVFRLAEDLNVQVFATTHSRDCVAAFEHSWEEHSDKGAFFRLERQEDDEIRVVAYPQQTLSAAVDTGVEVR